MKRKLLVFTVFILFTGIFNCFAGEPLKGNFKGVVKDAKTNKPLQSVSVFISDLKLGSRTNERGEFSFNDINEGVHLVEISHIGYNTIAENINVKGETYKVFLMAEAIVENDVVVVTGVTRATRLKKIPFQVSSIKQEDLFKSSAPNIIEGLVKEPGVSTLTTGQSVSKPLIRGLGYNRVLVINDGVRQEGQQWGDEHGIEIDESSVKKIEILKGPASLIYGSDAMAGVINIISNLPIPENTLNANLGSNYQTNSRLRAVHANVAGNVNGFNWNVYGSVKAAADYRNKYDGYVFNSKFNEHNFGGFAGVNKSWGYSHLLFSSYNMNTGLVEGERDSAGDFIRDLPGGIQVKPSVADNKSVHPVIPYQHISHTKVSTDNRFKIGGSALNLTLGWQRNQRQEFGNPDDANERSLYFDLQTFTYLARLQLKERNGWKPSIGINGMQQQNHNKGVEELIPDYSLFDIGGYVYVQKELGKLTLSGGARWDSRYVDVDPLMDGLDIKSNGFDKRFANFSGSIGGTYQVSKLVNIKANVARAFRAPGISELASNGAHEGTNRYEYGNQNLQSEISTQFDAGVEFATRHFSFNLAGYYNNFHNFIFYRKLQSFNGGDSVMIDNGDAIPAFKFEQQKAHLAGIEASLDVHPHPLDWLHIENTFSMVSGRLAKAIEGVKDLPYIPAPRLLTELRADFKELYGVAKNVYVNFEIENTFKQSHPFTAYNTETATPGYTLLNAGLGADISSKKGVTICSINFSITNLANIAYQSHLSRLKYLSENLATGRTGVYNMGRNFSIKLNIPLNVNLKGKG